MATTVLMRHRVDPADDAWLERFIGDTRLAGPWRAMRSAEDPEELVLVGSFDSRADAERFLGGTELREALRTAGVEQNAVRVEILDAIDASPAG